VVDEVAPGQVFSEYFGFPCQFSSHRLFHIHHQLSSGPGTTGQLVADVPSGLSLTHCKKLKRNYFLLVSCTAYSLTLETEAVCSSETPGNVYRATSRYIPEDNYFF
jgi:hypothetical protein